MVQTEIYQENYIRAWSDQDVYIAPVDNPAELYTEAVDLIDHAREYVETEIPIEQDEDATETDYIEALESLGVDINEETKPEK